MNIIIFSNICLVVCVLVSFVSCSPVWRRSHDDDVPIIERRSKIGKMIKKIGKEKCGVKLVKIERVKFKKVPVEVPHGHHLFKKHEKHEKHDCGCHHKKYKVKKKKYGYYYDYPYYGGYGYNYYYGGGYGYNYYY